MNEDWKVSLKFAAISTERQLGRRAAQVPPRLKEARDSAKAARNAAGRGRGGGSGGAGRGHTRCRTQPPQPRPPQRQQRQRPPPQQPQQPQPRADKPPEPPRESPRRNEPPRQQPEQSPSPPGSVKLIRKQLRGLRAAQGVERTAAFAQQIGELEYELEERERKHAKYGKW